MTGPLIGRTIRRLRQEHGLTQQALAARLGISASYLNLIEHDQRSVTAGLLLKLAEIFRVELAELSGAQERQLEVGLREVFADPLLGAETIAEAEIETLAASAPNAARAVLALYRAWRVAREDASGIALPSGRRILLPNEEARDVFDDHANYFPALETAAEAIAGELDAAPAERNHAIAERLRRHHGIAVVVRALEGLRAYDAEARRLTLSESLPRESRGFHMAFQLALLEAADAVETVLAEVKPSTPEAVALIRIGLLNYTAGALLMPYLPYREAAAALRHDMEALAARFGVSFEQACQRLSTLQRPGARGVPFFFLRVDPAGNVSKRFSAAGFPFARYGGSCPRWVVHTAFASPGVVRVQVAELPDGTRFLCFARTVTGVAARWGEPPPVHVVAMGSPLTYAADIVYAEGLDLERAAVGIGLSCRLCERPDCRSRAFPPLEHRLAFDPLRRGASPYPFEAKR
ncbi:MAG: short-chain fatty acyl-CoA regulator family protein [Acidibrevibacterium sp.]|jgi:predicted transcriptional regulator/DNA-binding XRE family transcriptional regulator|uniref:helix-turn-helix domain-containing protein n=1 Tax=Acidibrevibacterium fodinaquatile TaxID=1969806 RepID=UPI0023A7C39E|nr:helix-turn-helix transcriptional regulator [Acidibrevibacterium fodinaquatile]MCA7119945.1 short-chain fatty acyl-CoA regulator family protein [Acidibrevibacterium fodinaquatile]